MKKLVSLIVFAMCLMLSFSAFASENTAPKLTEIQFNNAAINEEFSADLFEYTITLEDPAATPTLKSYKLSGKANIFLTYELDEAKHQTGILVTLEYDNGSLFYKFRYSNPASYKANSNNLLKKVDCRLGEVYPKINDSQTEYKLYIPSDLTEINLSAATKDTGAFCDVPKAINLGVDQEPEISVTVTASDGSTRVYTFEVTRLEKTCTEVQKEMDSPDFDSLVKGELFWQKPAFKVGILCTATGIIILLIFIKIAKRLTVKLEDEDEKSFFETEE